MNVREQLRLQGMSADMPIAVSAEAMGRMLGNTMSQNILERLFVHVLPLVGLAEPGVLVDRWQGS